MDNSTSYGLVGICFLLISISVFFSVDRESINVAIDGVLLFWSGLSLGLSAFAFVQGFIEMSKEYPNED